MPWISKSMAFIIIYKNQGFAFGVNITAIKYPKNIAAAINIAYVMEKQVLQKHKQ